MKDIEVKIIGFGDTKLITNEQGNEEIVSVFIPECCREGWPSCKHVVKRQKPAKRNIAL